MDNVFGSYLFQYNFEYKGEKSYYIISRDARDFVAMRNSSPEIDVNLFPQVIAFGKMNDKVVPCGIENDELYNAILQKIKSYLEAIGSEWGSHYSITV